MPKARPKHLRHTPKPCFHAFAMNRPLVHTPYSTHAQAMLFAHPSHILEAVPSPFALARVRVAARMDAPHAMFFNTNISTPLCTSPCRVACGRPSRRCGAGLLFTLLYTLFTSFYHYIYLHTALFHLSPPE